LRELLGSELVGVEQVGRDLNDGVLGVRSDLLASDGDEETNGGLDGDVGRDVDELLELNLDGDDVLSNTLNGGLTSTTSEGINQVVVLEEHVGVVGEVLKIRAVEDPAAAIGINPGHHTKELVSAAIEGARPELARVSAIGVVGDRLIKRDGGVNALSYERGLEVDGELIVGVGGEDSERDVGSGSSRD
jgi:hypothetical protein